MLCKLLQKITETVQWVLILRSATFYESRMFYRKSDLTHSRNVDLVYSFIQGKLKP